jgi:prolyl oligopeptidase
MKIKYLIVFLIIISSCNYESSKLNYPKTKIIPVIDDYFGISVTDNYRWLEDDKSLETSKWINSQNKFTFDYLNEIPYRDEINKKIKNLWNYEKLTSPFKEGEFVYYYKNDGLQNQYVLYRKKENNKEEVFLDPNTFSLDGTTSLTGVSFSKNGKLCAYSISEGGSDWRKVMIIDALSKNIIEDTIRNVKFSGIQWKNNEGFFYSSYDKPKGSELSEITDQHKLYYHKIGTSQNKDLLIFGEKQNEKHRYVSGNVTDDGKFLFISVSKSTSGNKLYVKKLTKEKSPIINMIDNYKNDTYLLENDDDLFYLVTNLNAPNKKVVNAKYKNPQSEYWKDFIPESENVLFPSSGGGYIFAKYMINVINKVFQYNKNGENLGEIDLPSLGSVYGLYGEKEDVNLYYTFTNYHSPGVIYKYNVNTKKSKIYWEPEIDFKSSDYISNQVFFESFDGTKIPMIITHKKGIKYDGKNPTMLYGYGGFNISLSPSFSILNAFWMDQGGVYAVPNLRGGGEFGKEWHLAGTKMNKQNVFDDFISAAEYLFKEKITSSDFLAIRGGSNGGLLVGAVMTQRPDIAKVALPAVGVLDMLRYHKFTAGAGWSYDYGTSEESNEMFEYLKNYSPLQNVKLGVNYPSTLITTADHDDRVVPAHSFKFASELQEKHNGSNPVLIRIETKAGHGSGTPISKIIDQYSDIFGFTFYNMGYNVLPEKSKNKLID